MKRRFHSASAVASAALTSTMTALGANAGEASDPAGVATHSQVQSVQSTMNGSSKSKTRVEQSTTTLEDGQYVTRTTITTIEDGNKTVEEVVITRPANQ